jgi:hypothetical protein
MAKQGYIIESKVGKCYLENNSLNEGSKSIGGNKWEECNNLKKCSRLEKCFILKDKSLEENMLEENNVGEGYKLELKTSKENNDGNLKT